MSDPPWPSFFGDTDTYDLGLPWDYNVGPSWPAAPAMGGIGMEEGTIADEGAGRLYEYLDCAAAALPHGTQLGDFQPPPADPATPTGMIMPAAERVRGESSASAIFAAPASAGPSLQSLLRSQAAHALVPVVPLSTTQRIVSSPINPHNQRRINANFLLFFLKPPEKQVKCLLGAIYRPSTFQVAPLWVGFGCCLGFAGAG